MARIGLIGRREFLRHEEHEDEKEMEMEVSLKL